ncbi:xanthine dehydrogenase accessory protein XdhC [Pseudooceanicola sp. C21-150M6]|uniref:xanthine dehydrogenase accessory protein XdhC n=1 Tax=Pseudooceanicola sp. C21-150M6 TaxID=3434355 RepID=UPI003D7F54DD
MADLARLSEMLEQHGPLVRVIVAEVRGSAPREVGATMLVSPAGLVDGTIGGGALELEAIHAAQGLSRSKLDRRALGPDFGQCCGGAVTLAYDLVSGIPEAQDGLLIRRIDGPEEMPLSLRRRMSGLRNGSLPASPALIEGWLVEPVTEPATDLWIWGAGHVGRALVSVLAPLPDIAITWVDTAPNRFPETIPAGVTPLPAAKPELLVPHAPEQARHLILTYSHSIDLALCDALLRHGFASAGLIGSASKWARFRSRLRAAGHSDARIGSITCPIGDPAYGKHPQAIAVSVAAALLKDTARKDARRDMTG